MGLNTCFPDLRACSSCSTSGYKEIQAAIRRKHLAGSPFFTEDVNSEVNQTSTVQAYAFSFVVFLKSSLGMVGYLLFLHAPVRGLVQVIKPEHCGGFRFGGNEKQIIRVVL